MTRRVRTADLVALIEASYRTDGTADDWLFGIGDAFERLVGHGRGALLYRYRQDKGQLRPVGRPVFTHTRSRFHFSQTLGRFATHAGLIGFLDRIHPQLAERSFLAPCGPGWLVAQASAIAERHRHPEWMVKPPPLATRLGITDIWGMNVPDARGGGLTIGCPERELREHPRAHFDAIASAADAIQAGQRLRGHVEGIDRSGSEEAVFSPDGKLADATGAARSPEARSTLSDVVRRLDSSRARQARSQWSGEPVWPGIISGRWSLVQRVETDGRRFIIAHANAKGVVNPRKLSPQEKEIANWAAAGLMNKEIASAAGCSVSSVEATLARVIKKLGLGSRLELVLDYKSASKSLAHHIGGLSADEPLVALESQPRLNFGADLTEAQQEVATMIAQSYSNAEIARRRGTTTRTVANQVRAIFERCQVQSRAELLARALSDNTSESE